VGGVGVYLASGSGLANSGVIIGGQGGPAGSKSADPGGVLWKTIGPEHAVAGSVL
jgi:hypothetical protein